MPSDGVVAEGRVPVTASASLTRVRPPLARVVVEAVAIEHGVCLRPIPMRRVDLETGASDVIDVPCGATLSSKCPPCAHRARVLRMAQCRTGWHLEAEPEVIDLAPTEVHRSLVEARADLEVSLVAAHRAGVDDAELVSAIATVNAALAESGTRGQVGNKQRSRRARSTKRRQDVPALPRRRVSPQTLGRTYEGRDGQVFRPSTFMTLTCRSYGKVDGDGVPVDMDSYDYRCAARDAIHFPKLVDRFWQNLRRTVGFEVQYFAALEPQRRLAPHLHAAMRGTLTRADLRLVARATYHQVWWPPTVSVQFEGQHLPSWDAAAGSYIDPKNGDMLPTWSEALDAAQTGDEAEPAHVVRFGAQVHAQGVLSGTADAKRCIRYLVKYLNKSIDSCHETTTAAQDEHLSRMWEAIRYEPCSPTCANWLRYGVQPDRAHPGLIPGYCKGRAHRRETLGFGGRRVLVSRKWSGLTLAEHRAGQRDWARKALGLDADEATARYVWIRASPADPDVLPHENRLLLAIAARDRWRQQIQQNLAATDDGPAATQSAA